VVEGYYWKWCSILICVYLCVCVSLVIYIVYVCVCVCVTCYIYIVCVCVCVCVLVCVGLCLLLRLPHNISHIPQILKLCKCDFCTKKYETKSGAENKVGLQNQHSPQRVLFARGLYLDVL